MKIHKCSEVIVGPTVNEYPLSWAAIKTVEGIYEAKGFPGSIIIVIGGSGPNFTQLYLYLKGVKICTATEISWDGCSFRKTTKKLCLEVRD